MDSPAAQSLLTLSEYNNNNEAVSKGQSLFVLC